jgi:hypothetical protein
MAFMQKFLDTSFGPNLTKRRSFPEPYYLLFRGSHSTWGWRGALSNMFSSFCFSPGCRTSDAELQV